MGALADGDEYGSYIIPPEHLVEVCSGVWLALVVEFGVNCFMPVQHGIVGDIKDALSHVVGIVAQSIEREIKS